MIISHATAPYQMHVAQQQTPAATAAMFPTASRPSMAFAAPLSVPQNLNAVTVIPPPTPVSLQLATTTPPTTMYVGPTQQQQQQHMHQPVPVHNPYAIGSPPQINLYPQQSFVVPSLPQFTAHVTAQPQQPQQQQQLVHAHHFTTPQALAIDLNPLPTSAVVIYDDSKMQRTLCEGRYIPDCIIGKGTYGEVLRCFDTRSHTHVAVKIAHRDMAYRKSAMTEVNILSRLSQCSSIVRLLDVFEDDNRVCIVSELLFKNLYDIQRSRNFEAMHVSDVRHVSFAVISALTALHQNGGIHCDVKPENVMLRSNDFRSTCLIDFGAVRQFFENQYYDVQSLWYRAPEVLMGVPYNHMIDSWGVGCLLYELQTGSPLLPGENVDDQLERIVALCGAPGIEHASQPGTPHTTKLSVMYGAHRQPSHETLRQAFRNMIKPTTYHFEDDAMLFADLVARLLHPDPNRRLSCFDALCHPFFSRMDAPVSVPMSSELQHTPASSTRRRTSHIACAPTHHLVGRPIVANTNDDVLGGSCTNLPANITYTAGANIFATSPQVNSVPSFLANVQGTTAITTPRHHHVQHATYVLPSFPTVQAGQRVAWCSPPDVSMSIPQHTSHPSSSARRQHPQSSEVNWVDTRAHVHVNWCIS